MIANMTLNPTTHKSYKVSMIEKALAEAGFSIQIAKNNKSQALDGIKLIKEKNIMPLIRIRIKIWLTCKAKEISNQKETLRMKFETIQEEVWEEYCEIIGIIEPYKYREVVDLIHVATKGKGKIEVLKTNEADFNWN